MSKSKTKKTFDRQERYSLSAPSRSKKFFETRVILETLALPPSAPWLLMQPRGDGRQVMLVPGFMTDDWSTWPLRRYLKTLGYSTLPWSLGRNKGQPEVDAERLVEHLDTVRRDDQAITLIGWSLGGVIAREVARLVPDAVREVITMGTPVEGGPKYTFAAQRFSKLYNVELDEFEQHVHEVNSKGITQPLTVIYSKSDGVVGWRAAIDRYNPHARHVCIPSSHVGLGTNPLVWREIAQTLAGKSKRHKAA